jgi:hypothetical protein
VDDMWVMEFENLKNEYVNEYKFKNLRKIVERTCIKWKP